MCIKRVLYARNQALRHLYSIAQKEPFVEGLIEIAITNKILNNLRFGGLL